MLNGAAEISDVHYSQGKTTRVGLGPGTLSGLGCLLVLGRGNGRLLLVRLGLALGLLLGRLRGGRRSHLHAWHGNGHNRLALGGLNRGLLGLLRALGLGRLRSRGGSRAAEAGEGEAGLGNGGRQDGSLCLCLLAFFSADKVSCSS